MIKINLLPVKAIKKRLRQRREFFAFAGSVVALLLLLAGAFLLLNARLDNLTAEIAKLEKQRANYLAIQRQINTLQQNREALETKINTIKRLRVNSQLPVRVLDEISNLTPPQRMWLNSLRLSGNTLNIAGVGLDNPSIAQYMQSLERSPYFGGVDLASSTQSEIGGQKLKSFSLTIGVTPPPEIVNQPEAQPEKQPEG